MLNIPSPGTLSEIRNTKLVPDQGSGGITEQSEEKTQTSIGRRPILKKLENNRQIKKMLTLKSLSDISNTKLTPTKTSSPEDHNEQSRHDASIFEEPNKGERQNIK